MTLEALTFMLDSFVIILVVFMGLRDDRLAPGQPQKSLFRTRDIAPDTPKPSRKAADWAWNDSDTDVSR